MKLAAGIRSRGFKAWYERELLLSHLHLPLVFICLMGVLAAFEAASKNGSLADRSIDLASILLCGGAGLWALRRYLFLLVHAEAVAKQASCPACGTYARFRLVRADASDEQARVCCRQCSHEWTIQS